MAELNYRGACRIPQPARPYEMMHGRLLPGVRVPDAWTLRGVSSPYSLRFDGHCTYLIFGSEEIVAAFPVAQYQEERAAYERAVLDTVIHHSQRRSRWRV
jgi:hypothetical protein